MKKIIVLGAGLVGKVMAIDLAKDHEVTSADLNEQALADAAAHGVATLKADLSDTELLKKIVEPFDLVVGAVPGFMGYRTAEAVITAGKNMADISFFSEDAFGLDELAKQNNVTIVTDCGVAPGMSNIILGYHHANMKIDLYECLVGGLPVERTWPYEYKAVFSPIDVIEEYTRPARYVVNGAMVTREALSDIEPVRFDGIGTLESWNSDGLRSLIHTMPDIPNMIEKTLRYPGCMEYIRVLRETGFFNSEPVMVDGRPVRPIDLTAKLLFPIWKLKPGEEEFTVMRIRIAGTKNGQPVNHEYRLLDRTDKATGTLSMARTTGYTCTAVANLILNGGFSRKGICPPEYVGEADGNFNFVRNYLVDRGVHYLEN